ncbi:MAG: LysR family transcriptional regulator [Clostridiales bacterium]|nr:LysR family transcriptional regulator [Clostridiales bacterium]
MDFKNLYTFQTILEEGSFYKAAERLSYTQSTITNQITQLEQELHVRLFEKIGRKNELTQEGKRLIPYVNQVLSSVNALKSFDNSLADNRGEIRIGVAETFLCYRLPPVVRKFNRAAPKATMLLHSLSCHNVRDSLIRGTCDVGIFYEEIGGIPDTLEFMRIGKFPLSLVASPETAERYPDFITHGQRIEIPLLSNEHNCIYRTIFEDYLRRKDITLNKTVELWSIPTIKNLVMNNMGITFLPRFTTETEVKNGTLREIPTDLEDSPITAICCWHKNKWISPIIRLFLDLCKEEYTASETTVSGT